MFDEGIRCVFVGRFVFVEEVVVSADYFDYVGFGGFFEGRVVVFVGLMPVFHGLKFVYESGGFGAESVGGEEAFGGCCMLIC